jgi:restriction endonuclease Mrr
MTNPSRGEIKQQLQQMDPYEFEELVAELWELQGYETTVRKASGDRGIDIEARKENPCKQKILIQAKQYGENNNIGSGDVRKYATLYQQVPDADIVAIVTTGNFTREGTILARNLDVRLIDGQKLLNQIEMLIDEIDRFHKETEEDTDESSEKEQQNTDKSGEKQEGGKKGTGTYDIMSRVDLVNKERKNKHEYSEREERYDREYDDKR